MSSLQMSLRFIVKSKKFAVVNPIELCTTTVEFLNAFEHSVFRDT